MTASADQQKIWAHFQNAAPQSFAAAHPRLDFLLRQISRRAGQSKPAVLNVGIGDGYLERRARQKGWHVESIDPDEQAVGRLAGEGISARAGTIERLPLADGAIDFAVASEVFEHLTDDQRTRGLAELARVLRPGGWFLGTVPHAENLSEQQTVCPRCGEVFHRWGHQRAFTLADIRSMLSPPWELESLGRTAFVDLWGRGPRGLVKGVLRIALAKLGEPIAVPTIWWIARRR